MPAVDTILDSLGTSSFLSMFDLVKGFQRFSRDRQKTGDVTLSSIGVCHLAVGMTLLYSRCIVLYDVLVYCRAYMDDVVVFSSSWEEHVLHLKCTLQAIQKVCLTRYPEKCE